MKRIYFTIAGTKHHYGQDFFKPEMSVRLVKEPDNEVDTEAIRVEMDGLGLVGYVANSPYTVIGESYSAGRIYDKISDTAEGTVLYVLPRGILCFIDVEEYVTCCGDNADEDDWDDSDEENWADPDEDEDDLEDHYIDDEPKNGVIENE